MPLPISRLVLTLALLAPLASLCAQADPSVVPVEDDSLRTPAGDELRLVLKVTNASGLHRVAGVQVGVYDLPSERLVATGVTDVTGTLTVDVPFTGAYRLETCAPHYLPGAVRVRDCGSEGEGERTLMCVEGFDFFTYDDAHEATGVDHLLLAELHLDSLAVGEIVDLDRILYDYDKATLRPESKVELDQLVRALEQLPGLVIELRSHTDSRGTDAYNQDLSQRRAQSVVDYLIAHGIDSDRFSARGFGESRLVNECTDGVTCTEEQHQRNRRTEFEIKAFEYADCPELSVVGTMQQRRVQAPAERG